MGVSDVALQENACFSLFECLPYVCPEPVLVKRRDFKNQMASQKDVYSYLQLSENGSTAAAHCAEQENDAS
jgi:hypothetical protein